MQMPAVSLEWVHQQLGALYMANVQLNETVDKLTAENIKLQPKKKVKKENENHKNQRPPVDKGTGSEN